MSATVHGAHGQASLAVLDGLMVQYSPWRRKSSSSLIRCSQNRRDGGGVTRLSHRCGAMRCAYCALRATVKDLAKLGDYVICLGAGSITQWAYALPGELQACK